MFPLLFFFFFLSLHPSSRLFRLTFLQPNASTFLGPCRLLPNKGWPTGSSNHWSVYNIQALRVLSAPRPLSFLPNWFCRRSAPHVLRLLVAALSCWEQGMRLQHRWWPAGGDITPGILPSFQMNGVLYHINSWLRGSFIFSLLRDLNIIIIMSIMIFTTN